MADKLRFYLVWNEKTGYTRYKQYTKDRALEEAERLARRNPGEEFHVLGAVASCKAQGTEWTEFVDLSYLPF